MMTSERYETAEVKNGVIRTGDRVCILGEATIETDAGTQTVTNYIGTAGAITRRRPIRSNKTMVEILDADGIWVADVWAKNLRKVD